MSRENGIVFEKGWVIVCPACKLRIAECLKDQYPHHLVFSEDFRSLGEWRISGVMRCPKCSEPYMRRLEGMNGLGQVHSDHGWQPDLGEVET